MPTNASEVQQSRVEAKDDQMFHTFTPSAEIPCLKKLKFSVHAQDAKSTKKRRYQDFLDLQNQLSDDKVEDMGSADDQISFQRMNNSLSPSSSSENKNKINLPQFNSFKHHDGSRQEGVDVDNYHLDIRSFCY